MPVSADTGDDEHPLADDLTILPDMFVAGIDAQVGIGRLRQGAGAPCVELRIQLPGQFGDETLRETRAA